MKEKKEIRRTILHCGGCAWLAMLLCVQLSGAPGWSGLGAVSGGAVPAWESYPLVAHAVGSDEDRSCIPAEEIFRENYQRGYRVFECDILLTADGVPVLRHDWLEGMQEGISPEHIPTAEEFLSTPIYGQYTPLSFADLLQLMAEYPDIYVITDTKSGDDDLVRAQFSAMTAAAEELGLQRLLSRLIVQLYTPEMQDVVEEIYPFSHYMLTLYETGFAGDTEEFAEYAQACAQRGIGHIVMWHYLFCPDFLPIMEEYGIQVYVHTVNDAGTAADLLAAGVSGIYSDRIDPSGFPRRETCLI